MLKAAPRIASLTCVIVQNDGWVPAAEIAALSEQAAALADHAEIVVVANGVGPATSRELAEMAAAVPDVTVHFLADPTDADIATLIGMDRALGDWIVVTSPTRAEVEALPQLLAAAGAHEVVFAAPPGVSGSSGLYGLTGRAFFGLSGRLAGARLEWPTPRLRLYSRAAVRWLTGRLDGAMLMRSLSFRGSFPGRLLEVPTLEDPAAQTTLFRAARRALRGVAGASTTPLRLAIGLACGGVVVGLGALVYVATVFLTQQNVQPGWTTLSGLLAVMMAVFSALFALLTAYILAMYSSIQPRARLPVVRELRSPASRLDGALDVVSPGGETALGARPDQLPDIRP